MTCTYSSHYRNGTPVCDSCKAAHAVYAKRWRAGRRTVTLTDRVVDVVETHQPVAVAELEVLLPGAKPETLRRTVYRLLGRDELRRVSGERFTVGAA